MFLAYKRAAFHMCPYRYQNVNHVLATRNVNTAMVRYSVLNKM